jgi:Zn-dependent metalloprotease
MKNKLTFAICIPFLVSGMALNAQRFIERRIKSEDGRSSLIIFNPGTTAKELASSDNRKFFSEVLALPTGSTMIKTESAKLFSDFSDDRYQLYHKGIKVEFANYILHYIKGNLVSMNGEIYDASNVNTQASISEATALDKAMKYLGSKTLMTDTEHGKDIGYQPKGELVLLPVEASNGKYRLLLSYKFDIFSAEPFVRSHVYVDAKSGAILLNDQIMKHAGEHSHGKGMSGTSPAGPENQSKQDFASIFVTGSAQTKYSGTKSIETTLVSGTYALKDNTRGGGVNTYNNNNNADLNNLTKNNITDTDNNWTTAEHSSTGNDVALDIHWGVGKTYDYFKTAFNRNSYDNQGAALNSYVHVGTNYGNAAWYGNAMIYGDGNSTYKPLGAFDVTAHELGHAICQETAKLVYQRESGALNEAFSDIWGAVVENAYAPEKQNFLIGEDITKVAPNYLRSMSNPNSGLDQQPDTYKGTYWKDATNSCIPNPDTNDNCGVHYNSGVLNYWFYLLVMGGSGTNDIGNSFNVTGVGFEKAAKIVYRLETSYLTANSNYASALLYGIQSAKDLFGANSQELIATQNAFYAVGLGQEYTGPAAGADLEAPAAPQLTVSSTTSNSTTLSWTGATDNVAVTGYDIYKGPNLLDSTTSATTYSVSGLLPSTPYSFSVKAKDAAGNISVESNKVQITTKCAPAGVSTTNQAIVNVNFAGINKSSKGNPSGYENFTSVIGNVVKGNTYTITITPWWLEQYTFLYRHPKANDAYAVYIDYNGDGDFTDAGELAWSKAPNKDHLVSGNIMIPLTAVTGDVQMRVILKYNSLPTSPCEDFGFGEVEDYMLRISNVNPINSLIAVNPLDDSKKINIYPNPVKDIIKISSSSSAEFKYQFTDTHGRAILSGETKGHSINVESLIQGVYILSLDNGNEKTIKKIIKK